MAKAYCTLQDLTALQVHISAKLGDKITADIALDELALTTTADHLLKVLTFLRDDKKCLFKQLIELAGVDYPARAQRFEVVYCLLSLHHNRRIKVRVVLDAEAVIPSITGVYSAAGWMERELWDMYGIRVAGNPDLRRILTDYGFEGHPLRKDFPLTGYYEVRYDPLQQKVVYEPVTLQQDFRSFDALSPWEGAKYILPGDEKARDEKSGSAT